MKAVLVALLVLCALSALAEEGHIDLVVVLDISGSMPENSLVTPVINTFSRTLDQLLNVGDTVTLITFGSGTYSHYPTMEVDSQGSTDQLKEYVSELSFSDQQTYHALAIERAFEKCASLESDYPNHQQVILFLTDGENDPPDGLPDEITLEEVRVDSSKYNTDWFVVHVQMNADENTEVGRVLSDIFEDRYLFSDRIEEAFARIESLLENMIFLSYEPDSDIQLNITKADTVYADFADLIVDIQDVSLEDLLEFRLDFPILPSNVSLSDSIVAVDSNRLRIFLRAKAEGLLSPAEYSGFIRPALRSEGSRYRISGGTQDILIELSIDPPGPESIDWLAEPAKLETTIDEVDEPVTGQIIVSGLPNDLDSSLVSVQLDIEHFPEQINLGIESTFAVYGRIDFDYSVTLSEDIPNGDYTGSIFVHIHDNPRYSAESLEIPIEIHTSVIPPKWPKYLALILGVGVLIFLIWGILRIYASKRLFGILYYWPDDGSSPKRRKDLKDIGTHGEVGISDIKLDGLSETIGTMAVEKYDSHRFVRFTATTGHDISIDGRKEASIRLHNHDAFMIDDWHFEYRGRTPRRK